MSNYENINFDEWKVTQTNEKFPLLMNEIIGWTLMMFENEFIKRKMWICNFNLQL